MKQYDVVRIIKDDPNNEFTKGQVGTILEVYEDNNYEVEISDKDGITLFLGAISGDYLQ
ncbi:DUF4926 domain-containing protein [Peribacillus frigoritolerans]|uniref:DUF4926 domain-containing protein n=2 Tax=Bacillaceae TaxID=186817 RepID=UPI001059F46A|nr:DUF4926 domain-containing protein [Peribacillus frigoritolerans]TDL82082.1 DUF4926 domain-containing protein [Peribacillus frigoritolerans]